MTTPRKKPAPEPDWAKSWELTDRAMVEVVAERDRLRGYVADLVAAGDKLAALTELLLYPKHPRVADALARWKELR